MSGLNALINFDSIEVKSTIKILLQDKSTKKNIIWATDTYSDNGIFFADNEEITEDLVSGAYSKIIQPRYIRRLRSSPAGQENTPRYLPHPGFVIL